MGRSMGALVAPLYCLPTLPDGNDDDDGDDGDEGGWGGGGNPMQCVVFISKTS